MRSEETSGLYFAAPVTMEMKRDDAEWDSVVLIAGWYPAQLWGEWWIESNIHTHTGACSACFKGTHSLFNSERCSAHHCAHRDFIKNSHAYNSKRKLFLWDPWSSDTQQRICCSYGENIDVSILGCNKVCNVGIYQQVLTALQPRRPA